MYNVANSFFCTPMKWRLLFTLPKSNEGIEKIYSITNIRQYYSEQKGIFSFLGGLELRNSHVYMCSQSSMIYMKGFSSPFKFSFWFQGTIWLLTAKAFFFSLSVVLYPFGKWMKSTLLEIRTYLLWQTDKFRPNMIKVKIKKNSTVSPTIFEIQF